MLSERMSMSQAEYRVRVGLYMLDASGPRPLPILLSYRACYWALWTCAVIDWG